MNGWCLRVWLLSVHEALPGTTIPTQLLFCSCHSYSYSLQLHSPAPLQHALLYHWLRCTDERKPKGTICSATIISHLRMYSHEHFADSFQVVNRLIWTWTFEALSLQSNSPHLRAANLGFLKRAASPKSATIALTPPSSLWMRQFCK